MEGVGKANQVVQVGQTREFNPFSILTTNTILIASCQVNSGYFNNFLRPKGLASIISDEEVQVIEQTGPDLMAKKNLITFFQ